MNNCRLLFLPLLFLSCLPNESFAVVPAVKETAQVVQPSTGAAMTEKEGNPADRPQMIQAAPRELPQMSAKMSVADGSKGRPTAGLDTDMPKPGQAAGITLRQAEQIALENNLNLLIETYNTRASQASVDRGFGLYDPTLSVDLVDGQQKDLINSQAFSGLTEVDFFNLNTALSQKLPSGAGLTLSFMNGREDISSVVVPPVNPEHTSEVSLSIVQPLLQGFGPTVTEQEILLSIKDRETSVQDLRTEVFNLLSAVRNTYYETLRTRDDLTFREASVRVAEQVLKENRARVEVGVLPKVELLEAEVGLKSRQRDLLDADRVYRNSLDQLALLLNSDQTLQPSMRLEQHEVPLDEEQGYSDSLVRRPDLQRRLRELDRIDLEKVLSEDLLKPNLDLRASYGQQGLGDGFGTSLSSLGEDDLHIWQLGLSFSYPLGNQAARSDLQRNRVRQKGKLAELQQLKAEIRTEIRLAIRQVKVARSKIEVSQSERALAEEKLEILLGRKNVGLATTRDVLEGEQDLASAQSELVTALADYNKAVTEYLRVTGQLLEHEGVRFAGELNATAEGSVFSLE